MRKITNAQELQQAIRDKEQQLAMGTNQMHADLSQLKTNLSPKNVVKNSFSYLAETPEIHKTLFNTIIGFALGYATKKAADLLSEQSLDNLTHNLVHHGLSRLENQNPEGLLSKGISYVRKNISADSPMHPFLKYR